jgi:alpha-methylacyl-CoA racemase
MGAAFLAGGNYREERAANLLDGGMPFYDLYETSDGRHMSVGPLEPQFYDVFVELLGIDSAPDRFDLDRSEELRTAIAKAFAARTQKEWTEVFEGTDACVAPILPLTKAMEHPHMSAREVFVEREGVRQPAPAPRFSRTSPTLGRAPAEKPGIDTRAALEAWGIDGVDDLIERGVAVQA